MSGIERIAAERRRQIEEEGFGAEHDGYHSNGELAQAASLYARTSMTSGSGRKFAQQTTPLLWPWAPMWWKPTTPLRDLAKAGALIAAEIDRRERLGETE